MFPDEMMQQAIGQAFGKCMEDALQPLVVRLTEVETQLATLSKQQERLLALVDQFTSSGSGIAKRLLGV